MPSNQSTALKKQQISLAQLSSYDDILTDALVDHVYYWTTIPKNRPSYHPSRGVKEGEITKIIQTHLIADPDLDTAESKLLATDGLRRFHQALKTPKEKDNFRAHLRRYMQIYLPDSPFEVSSTNRYTIVTHEAAVTARRFIRKGQPIKYLSGIQVLITEKEERELSKRKKDFSIVVSARNKCASLFMGPARFANHDCGANARLMITGQAGIEIIAARDIEIGDEITVTYSENYFGLDNCECLCRTCEEKLANGWAPAEGTVTVKKSIEAITAEGYSLRRRRRDDSCASASRTPSVTPDIRPRILKTRSKTLKMDSEQGSTIGSPAPQDLLGQKRKHEFQSLQSPPVTPVKRLKTLQYEVQPVSVPPSLSRSADDDSASTHSSERESIDMVLTDVTTPEEDVKEPVLQSPDLTPGKPPSASLKQEDSEASSLSEITCAPPSSEVQESIAVAPLPTVEHVPQADDVATTIPTLPNISEQSLSDAITLPPVSSFIPIPEPVQPIPSILEPAESSISDEAPRPTRGRPKGRSRKDEAPAVGHLIENATPPPRTRTPGDYTLTPVLLSEPNTAWIHCTVCSEPFVQQNAYYTRSSCPRCERHSKLYGYQWPKTEKEGKHDKEERVLDHRTVHRFLTAEDEAKIRGRKLPPTATATRTPTPSQETLEKRGRGRPRRLPQSELGSEDEYQDGQDGETGNVRRSTRRRNLSLKAAGS
ncbi:histone lysine methyltransferase Set9 [Parahypoxylon ruwenzoriense]